MKSQENFRSVIYKEIDTIASQLKNILLPVTCRVQLTVLDHLAFSSCFFPHLFLPVAKRKGVILLMLTRHQREAFCQLGHKT